MAFSRRQVDRSVLVLTGATAAVVWFFCWGVYPENLGSPLEYHWDANSILGTVQAYGHRGLGVLWGANFDRLGAPGEASWLDYPMEDLFFTVIGLLSQLLTPIKAVNVAFLGSAIASAVFLYLVAGRLGAPPALSWGAGVLFSASPYVFYRNVHHFALTQIWCVPAVVLMWLWATSRGGLRPSSRRFWFSLALCALLPGLQFYYFNYALHGLALAVLLQVARRRFRLAGWLVVLCLVGALSFLLVNVDSFAARLQLGPNPEAVVRKPEEAAYYGLHVEQLAVPPPTHRWERFRLRAIDYQQSGALMGEYPSSYLGLVPLVSLVFLAVGAPLQRLLRRRRTVGLRLFTFAGLLVALAVPGGLIQLEQSVVGQYIFRSNNRVTPFLSALALLFAAKSLRAVWHGLFRHVGRVVLGGLVVAGLWDQSPDLDQPRPFLGGRTHRQARMRWREMADSDRAFVQMLEQRLPANAAVVQLPLMPFPEAGSVMGLPDYEHFRLYANATTRLRWSYGAMKGRVGYAALAQAFSQPAPQVLAKLTADGFRAVVFASAALGKDTAAALASSWGLSNTQVIESHDGSWVAVIW